MPYTSRNIQGSNLGPGDYRTAYAVQAAADKSVALLIKYIGAEQSGLVAVTSGDLVFTHGDVSSEASDTTVGSNTAGSVDVSDSGENSIAEALALINQSANWIAVAVAAVGSDSIASNALIDIAAQQCKTAKGTQFFWDSSVHLKDSVLLSPPEWQDDIRVYAAPELDDKVDNLKPFKGTETTLEQATSTVTNASDDNTVFVVKDEDPTSATGSGTLFSQDGGDTTVLQSFQPTVPIKGGRSNRVLYRVTGTAQTAVVLTAAGETARKLN